MTKRRLVAAPAVAETQEPAPPVRDPYAAPTRDPYVATSGTSRWDPIPPLRPSGADLQRRRVMTEDAHPAEDWDWTSRGHSNSPEPYQDWQDDAPAEEHGEHALSRPWGLLSRFQQAHLITPTRKPVAGANADGSEMETDRDAAWQGSFQSNRKG